jgi:hypothetical protein
MLYIGEVLTFMARIQLRDSFKPFLAFLYNHLGAGQLTSLDYALQAVRIQNAKGVSNRGKIGVQPVDVMFRIA